MIRVELVMADAKTALTFLDLAETTRNSEDRARRIREARVAYETIAAQIGRLQPTAEQMEVLNRDMDTLKMRLRVAGAPID